MTPRSCLAGGDRDTVSNWYCRISGRESGPYTTHQVRMLHRQGRISLDTLIRPEQATRWQPASTILGSRTAAAAADGTSAPAVAIPNRPVPVGYVIAGAVALLLAVLLFLLLFLGCLAGRLTLFSGNETGEGDGAGGSGLAAADDGAGDDSNTTDPNTSDNDNRDGEVSATDSEGSGSSSGSADDSPAAEALVQPETLDGNFTINPIGRSPDAPAEPSASGGSGGGVTGGVGGLGGAGGTGGMSEFFGAKARGNRFVYIIDQSGSMHGSRFERACDELLQAVNDLSSRQQFYVYFFTTETRVMYDDTTNPPRLQRATPGNTQRLEEWVGSLQANGGNGAEAQTISAALELRPDAIYFLSDGGFDLNTGDIVRENNTRSRVPINTIGFGDRSYETLLQQIAEESGGTYTFVP